MGRKFGQTINALSIEHLNGQNFGELVGKIALQLFVALYSRERATRKGNPPHF